jgi:3-oxoacyl-[acyl-carrier-protein] synthase II
MREAWITGYGIVCAAGADGASCWRHLSEPTSLATRHPRYGYDYFPIRDFDYARHTPKRGDQRQMGDGMHYAVAAASSALAHANVELETIRDLNICVVARSGERDSSLDETLMAAAAQRPSDAIVNETLTKLRPSQFLAQLPNLMPSNISIVRNVVAASRTFMGSESTGVDALRHCVERILAQQGEIFLVGGASNAACEHHLVTVAANGWMCNDVPASVWNEQHAGYCLGSASAFLVVESQEHAQARGAQPLARVRSTATSFAGREDGERCEELLFGHWRRTHDGAPQLAVISGASGAGDIARREHGFLTRIESTGCEVAARAPARLLGHSNEASFFTNLVVALLCLEHRTLFAAADRTERFETPVAREPITRCMITSWGAAAGEAYAILEAVS